MCRGQGAAAAETGVSMTERISRFFAEQRPETPCLVVDLDMVDAAGNHQWNSRFVDQDGIGLVDHCQMQGTVDLVADRRRRWSF